MLPKLNVVHKKFLYQSIDHPDIQYQITAESETAARMLLPVSEKKAELIGTSPADECQAGVKLIKAGGGII